MAHIQTLCGLSAKIVDITGVIDGIALQTNSLALTASIEAGRAATCNTV